ncbi:MAG: HAD family hydrolase [Tepidisphaeraceae bacterium]
MMSDRLGVIFDMDGVLVDSYDAHLKSWRRVAREHELDVSDEDFARTFGRTSREIIRTLWPGKLDDAQIDAFDQKKEQAYRDILSADFPEMTGASELIGQLHAAGFALAIGSSGPPENVQLVVGKLRNGNLFTATVNGTEVQRGKPEPDVFRIAARKLHLPPQNCAVVEDALAGIEATRRAGMVAIGLVGTTTREALSQRSHIVVDSLSQLSPQRIQAELSVHSG